MAKLIKGDSIQNIITDGDIVITSPYKNGKTLNEVLVEQQSDIDKLKSNVKYIYAYGGVGNNGGSGGSGGSGDIDLSGYATKNFVYNEIEKIDIPDITTKQDIIVDLEDIRTGAELGATAIQESDLNEALNNYYTINQTDNLLVNKQDILSGSEFIQISENIISINSENLLSNYPVLDSENVLVAGVDNACFVSNPRRYEPETGEWVGNNTAEANFSSAFGFNCKINGSGSNSFIAGDSSTINSEDSFVFGQNCHVESNSSHSFVGGKDCHSYHKNCFVYGEGLFTQFGNSTVLGKYNKTVSGNWGDTVLGIVGDGYDSGNGRRNILLIQSGGDPALHCRGSFKQNATWINDFGEYFEWVDGNPDNENRIGYMVQLNGDKIEYAKSFEKCIGVISGTTGFVGGVCAFEWHNKFLRDEWGREVIGDDGNPILNPDFNPDLEYIPREQRKEWSSVGLLGQVLTRQDGTLEVGGFAGCKDGIATKSDIGYKVLKIVNENIALLLVK